MVTDKHMSPLNRAELVAWLFAVKSRVDEALATTEGDEMFKEQKNRCMANIESARANLAYAWNALAPFIER